METITKVWGEEKIICMEPEYTAKYLIISPGYQCSLHFHPIKKETFTVQEGTIKLEQRDVRGFPFEERLFPGESRTIMPKTPHRFSSVRGAVLLEVSTKHSDDDVVRIEESRRIE